MEILTHVIEFLLAIFVTPIMSVIVSLFSLTHRQSVYFIAIAYVVAFFIFLRRYKKQSSNNKEQTFADFIGWKDILLHPSALIDYQYYVVRMILKAAITAPLLAFIFLPSWISGEAGATALTMIVGENSNTIEVTTGVMLLYGLGVFFLYDFSHYWVHRCFHSGFLWEFHKVHHSAEVLVPQTANRVHFVESFFEGVLSSTLTFFYAGIFYYLCGETVGAYTILGAHYIFLIFNSIASNLRHTHIWLSFGSNVEHIINSPAQHQIHHSTDPKHFNKNFGTNLSIWDWMFGTLYVTTSKQEDIEFGLTPAENKKFYTLKGIILSPFVACFKRVKKFWRSIM